MLELLRVHQAAGPIVLEDELVAPHHVLARGALGIPEAVADHLEDDVVGGQREHQHDESDVAGGDLESIRGVVEMGHEVAVQLDLAVLVVPHGEVQLGDPLGRHDRLEEADHPRGHLDVDVERRAREAEHDARLVDGHEHGVGDDPALLVDERDHEGISRRPPRMRPTR